MRLVCPNCDAEYEIDNSAIPRDGRDVQCSNCGHAWYQTHPEIEAEQEAEADLYEAPPGAAAVAEAPAPQPEVIEDELEAAPPVREPGTVPAVKRTLDETVLAVLREEAERETRARLAEAVPKPVIETQTEMPLRQDPGGMSAAVRRIAKMRGVPDPEPAAVVPVATKSRGQMLPAIEEINSTLRATNNRSSDEDSAIFDTMGETEARSGSFRRGFLTLVGLAVVIVVLYVLAPLIKTQVPALAEVVDGYVATVNTARLALDTGLRSLVTLLRGLADGQTD
jgi:predicted Zn finger-like uncharacterized protein